MRSEEVSHLTFLMYEGTILLASNVYSGEKKLCVPS